MNCNFVWKYSIIASLSFAFDRLKCVFIKPHSLLGFVRNIVENRDNKAVSRRHYTNCIQHMLCNWLPCQISCSATQSLEKGTNSLTQCGNLAWDEKCNFNALYWLPYDFVKERKKISPKPNPQLQRRRVKPTATTDRYKLRLSLHWYSFLFGLAYVVNYPISSIKKVSVQYIHIYSYFVQEFTWVNPHLKPCNCPITRLLILQ